MLDLYNDSMWDRLEKLIAEWYLDNQDRIYQEYLIQENNYILQRRDELFSENNIGYPCGIRKRVIRIQKEID